jgi:hypothetical protein
MTAPGTPFVRPCLPPRGAAEEDAFVWGLLQDDAPPDDVAALVSDALDAGRPQLAARLVGLLSDDLHDPDLDRARAAARLIVQGTEPPPGSDLDAAWRRLRERRMTWRARLTEPWIRTNPLDPFPPRWRRR